MSAVMLDAALELAAAGWRVFPCIEHGDKAKAPYTSNGFHDATVDPEVIRAWWRRKPHAMIGAPVPDTLLVLDLDPRHGGTLVALEAVTGTLPETLTAWSGRNDDGRHLYFRRPAGGDFTSTGLPEGVDLRKPGRHYLIVPPSIHPATGLPYRWELRDSAPLPAQAAAVLRPRPPRVFASPGRVGSGSGLLKAVQTASEGKRNDLLYWAACRAVLDGHDEILDDLADAAIGCGLPARAAVATVESARKRYGAAS